MDDDGNDFSIETGQREKDLILGEINPNMFYEINHPSYAKGAKLDDPYLSPLYGDLTGLPPMLIQTGGYEVFLDEGMKLAEKAASDDVKVTLTVYPYMSHDFPSASLRYRTVSMPLKKCRASST